MKMSAKRGSALLIVLGFLSFMVVSAVAFSIYMRSERLPSSALRRAVSTRHLVKAALARAIGDIDDAVRHEPFPGCMGVDGPKIGSSYGGAWGGFSDSRRAEWYGRVFLPIGGRNETGMFITDRDDLFLIPPEHRSKSVSTMTLEGLGYIPPPLVNEARLIGPLSWSSTWHYFDYDAGRYAYTALNVSDYFDINRIHAYTNRTSGADGRLSLAYLFADTQGKVDPNKAKSFEELVHENRGGQPNYAFVSMLDYSLALRTKGASYDLANPFYDFLQNGRRTEYYGNVWSDALTPQARLDLYRDPEFKKIANQFFVTDSWCPSSNTVDATTCNLVEHKWQPFANCRESDANLDDLQVRNDFWEKALATDGKKMTEKFPAYTFSAMLYDYLDADSVPTSLVLPCAEYAPMIAAFDVSGLPNIVIKKEQVASGGTEEDETKTYAYKLGFRVENLEVNVAPVFPFKRARSPSHRMDSTSFKVQAVVRLFFAPPGTKNRSAGFGQVKWTDYSGKKTAIENDNSVVFVSDAQPISIPSSIEEEEDAEIKGVSLRFDNFTEERILMQVTEHIKSGATTEDPPDFGSANFRFLTEDYADISKEVDIAVVPQISVNLRVTCDSDTVDLVPARAVDDELNNRGMHAQIGGITDVAGTSTPLMRFATGFEGGMSVAPTLASMKALLTGGNEKLIMATDFGQNNQNAYLCPDPRFNWAPEYWFLGKYNNFNDWLTAARQVQDENSLHDRDIFISVSNVGYLQSVDEFMMIPRVDDLNCSLDADWGALTKSALDGTIRTSVAEIPGQIKNCMWRSYKSTRIGGEDDLEGLRIVSGNGGYKVNPYTDNDTIALAAIANTPVDWWAAATNTQSSSSTKKPSDLKLDTAIKYTFGPESLASSDRWTWENIKSVSQKLKDAFRSNSASANSWMAQYYNLWEGSFTGDSDEQLFGINMSGAVIHDVDRKFLYGYWRDCFGCCQQLYLIFVRAESTALGGSGDAVTPGQLGGRAVALVWRDPNEPRDSQDGQVNKPEDPETGRDSSPRPPHKTRILFYHQFD